MSKDNVTAMEDHETRDPLGLADLPLLEVVGHPVLVAPDPRLRRWGRSRGAPVADW